MTPLTVDPERYFPPPLVGEPSAHELDALLETVEQWPEGANGGTLVIPITPQVVRYLLRGTFSFNGRTARMVGGTLRGNEFTPIFRDVTT